MGTRTFDAKREWNMTRPAVCVAALTLALAAGQTPLLAQVAPAGTAAAERRLDQRAVPDVPLQLLDGRHVSLSTLTDTGTALFVAFFYGECTGVCLPLLEWLGDAARDVGGLGRDYQMLAVSFDDRDTVESLRRQVRLLDIDRDPAWHVAVTTPDAVDALTKALDFWYQPSAVRGQIDHSALFVAIRRGRVVGAGLGGPGDIRRFRELAWELRGRPVLSYAIDDAPPVRCLTYDPISGEWRPHWGLLLLIAPGLCSVAAALVVFRHRAVRPSPLVGDDRL